MARAGEAGVTLVEMLVALALFALIGLAGFTVLDSILRVQSRTEGRLERLAEVDRALRLVARDLAQARPGSAALMAEGLEMVRPGPEGDVRIRYALGVDGGLVRRIAGADGARAVAQVIAGDVAALEWRFLGPGPDWRVAWPPEEDPPPDLRAVEVRLALGGRAAAREVRLVTELALGVAR